MGISTGRRVYSIEGNIRGLDPHAPEIADDGGGKLALDLQIPIQQGGCQVIDPGSGLFHSPRTYSACPIARCVFR